MVVKINISISKEILDKLDEAAREIKMSRSALMSQAVEWLLSEREEKRRQERSKKAAEKINKIARKVGPWDATAEVLKWRDLH